MATKSDDTPIVAKFHLSILTLFAFCLIEAGFENAGYRPFSFANDWSRWAQTTALGATLLVFYVYGFVATNWLVRRFGYRNTERCAWSLFGMLVFSCSFFFQHESNFTPSNSIGMLLGIGIIGTQTLTPEFTWTAINTRFEHWLDRMVARSWMARRWPRFFTPVE